MANYVIGQVIRERAFVKAIYSTTLTTGIVDAATTGAIGVVNTAGFAASGAVVVENANGKIEADSESIAYTGITATTLTGITRGAGGTRPAAHGAGVRVWSLTDAAAQSIEIKPPSGTSTPVTPTHASVGNYTYEYEPTLPGTHHVRVVTTNPDSAAESSFFVNASPFVP